MLNIEHYRYKRRRRFKKGWLVLLALVLAGGGGAAAWWLGLDELAARLLAPQERGRPLSELWRDHLYDEVIARADAVLKSEPLAYYHKGKYYYDLALHYLQKALAGGFQASDIYDYLGLAATQLERTEEGLGYFQKALELNSTDLLLLMIGQSYHDLGRLAESEEYLLRALNKTDDPAIESKCRFLLAQMYFDRREYFKAENEYLAVLARDPDSAEAHFYLGEIYAALNDKVKARAEWRKTLLIDPSHYGAKLRYYK
jgi:tetratricopeptide (TPR) repeat protein